jgi:hypothetical protein
MKNHIKVQTSEACRKVTRFSVIFFSVGLWSCTHTQEIDRNPSAIEKPLLLDLRVSDYKQKLRTIQGHIVPLHFFKSDQGAWYFALGCGSHEKKGHTFEVYSKPLASPDQLQQNLEVARIRDSNNFSTLNECREAFETITAASSTKPVCLRETEEGVLVSRCRSLNRFESGERNLGRQF